MCFSINDLEDNPEMIQAGEELAKELKILLEQKYPDVDKINQCRSEISGFIVKPYAFSAILRPMIMELLKNIEHNDDTIPSCPFITINEIFKVLNDKYRNYPEKLKKYVDVLEDISGCQSFYSKLFNN